MLKRREKSLGDEKSKSRRNKKTRAEFLESKGLKQALPMKSKYPLPSLLHFPYS